MDAIRALRIEGTAAGIAGGAGGVEAPLLISGNTLRGTTSAPCTLENVSGVVRITDNDIRSTAQNPFVATTGLTGCYLHLSGNYIETAAGAFIACIVRGAAGVYFHSGEYKNGGGGIAVDLRADAASNPVGEAMFARANIVRQGTTNFTDDITTWIRLEMDGTGAPTTGYWPAGARIWNTAPTAGGYIGWVCTGLGTPGIWKGFGSIDV